MTEPTKPLLLPVDEVARMLFCSRRRVFELLADGTLLRGAKFGKQTTILAESVFQAMEKAYDPPAPKVKRVRAPRLAFSQAVDQWFEATRGRSKKIAKQARETT
jgi:hypothetical protein